MTLGSEMTPIDIANMPELIRLVEEVRATGESRVLCRDAEEVAMLVPLRKSRTKREKTKADWEAFLSAAGSWRDVDTDRLVKDIYQSRRKSSRPPVNL